MPGICRQYSFLRRAKQTRLSEGDLPVGMFPDATFQECRVRLPEGCSIVIYTDGVSDALNSTGEEFGEERIMRCLTSLPRPIEAEGICKHLDGKVAEWAAEPSAPEIRNGTINWIAGDITDRHPVKRLRFPLYATILSVPYKGCGLTTSHRFYCFWRVLLFLARLFVSAGIHPTSWLLLYPVR
jgi:hypothetical protein